MDERWIHGLESAPDAVRGGVLTIGNFDGVHVGHQRILRAARALADSEGADVVAMTFEPPPGALLHRGDPPQRISPPDRKAARLREGGATWVLVVETDAALLQLSAGEFIERIIVARLAPRYVVEGRNFYFGRGRAGNIDLLRSAGADAGFAVHVVDPVVVDLPEGPVRVSSTGIRSLLAAGRIEDANRCLGRPFALYGRVVAGAGRGQALGYPTVNLADCCQIVPADGVYAGRAALAGTEYAAAISIGTRCTFGAHDRAVEAFLLDADGTYYEQRVAFAFLQRLRGQVRFDGPQALKVQMAKDVQRVREICG